MPSVFAALRVGYKLSEIHFQLMSLHPIQFQQSHRLLVSSAQAVLDMSPFTMILRSIIALTMAVSVTAVDPRTLGGKTASMAPLQNDASRLMRYET